MMLKSQSMLPNMMQAGPPLPPITAGLVGWFTPGSFDFTNSLWRDLSGNGNDATLVAGSVTPVNSATGSWDHLNGQAHLRGATGSRIDFVTGLLTTRYTFFHVTRPTGSTVRRVRSHLNCSHMKQGEGGLAFAPRLPPGIED